MSDMSLKIFSFQRFLCISYKNTVLYFFFFFLLVLLGRLVVFGMVLSGISKR